MNPNRFGIERTHAAYRAKTTKPTEVAKRCFDLAREPESEGVFITYRPEAPLMGRAKELEAFAEELGDAVFERFPLYGIPYVVKDNIETMGLPVTSGCAASAYTPEKHSFAVQRLHESGCLLIGKTNMDQFATGLVGTRTPYPAPKNPFHPEFIPGGSSSGSAVAVARGYGAFALGTDTAGSGRVPAAFNHLVGWKPTKGLVSTRGLSPACRSLDCISVFANTASDAERVARVITVYDDEDPYARPGSIDAPPGESVDRAFHFGVLEGSALPEDSQMLALYRKACARLETVGGSGQAFDYGPFAEAASLLYDGPWVAERAAAVEKWLRAENTDVLPVIREVISPGLSMRGVDVFRGMDALAERRRRTERTWSTVDVLCLPTTPTIYRVEDVAKAPIELNRKLGRYTNFVNLLDLCAIALPAGFRADGVPLGITLVAPAHEDALLFDLAKRYEAAFLAES